MVQPDFSGLTPGVRKGVLTLNFDDGTSRLIDILSIIPAAGAGANKAGDREAASCGSATLNVAYLSPVEGAAASIGQGTPVRVKVGIVIALSALFVVLFVVMPSPLVSAAGTAAASFRF